jgi:hypothetical protein
MGVPLYTHSTDPKHKQKSGKTSETMEEFCIRGFKAMSTSMAICAWINLKLKHLTKASTRLK